MSSEHTVGLGADMGSEEFRAALQRVGDWVAAYRERASELPVLSRVRPGEVGAGMPETAPARGEPVEAWLADLDRLVVPGLTHWNHPGFMAYFGISGSGPGILGELVAAALNVNGMLWKTSPALTEIEQVVLRWLALALGLPGDWFGMIADTASTSTLVALAAAREAAGVGVRERGLAGSRPLVVYCSEEAHSSVDKAGIVLGVGLDHVRRIPSDGDYRMRVDLLEAAVREDLAAGRRPFAAVATVGTTSATAVDPVPAVADVCRRHGLWLHVDAAYAGSAAIVPEYRWLLDGCERADSLVTNPHKWLFTPIDCSVLYTSRPQVFRAALSLVPEYLRTDSGEVVDLMDYSFQLGRRFRALKLWWVLRHFGTDGVTDRIREHCRLARLLADWIDAEPGVERLAPVTTSVVCFRLRPRGVDDEGELERVNRAALDWVNAGGEIFLSHTKLKGRFCLRVAIGNLRTGERHVRRVLELVRSAAGLGLV